MRIYFNQDLITKEQNQKEWLNLCDYVFRELLCYESNQKFPNLLAIRLKGVATNQYIVKGKQEQIYTYSFILGVCKVLKSKIKYAIDTTEIKNEQHLVNLIIKIINDNFNDIVTKVKKKDFQNKIIDKNIESQLDNTQDINQVAKPIYNKTKRKVNDRLWKLE